MTGTLTALDYAYRLLGQRAYSAPGLAAKMRTKGFSPRAVVQTLSQTGRAPPCHFSPRAVVQTVDRLTRQGYLNDARLAAELTQHFQARGFGPAAIRQKLLRHHLDSALIAQTLAARQPGLDLDAARRLLSSRFPADGLQQAQTYARAYRLLVRRGYSCEFAEQLLGSPPQDEKGTDDLM